MQGVLFLWRKFFLEKCEKNVDSNLVSYYIICIALMNYIEERRMKVRLRELECKRCGWKWTPRTSDVRTCPNPECRSVYWDKEREQKRDEFKSILGRDFKELLD